MTRARVPMGKATKLIDDAQPRAAKTLIDALEATFPYPIIVGRDPATKKPIYEYQERPDHSARTQAAKILLGKRIPDLAKTEVENTGEMKYVIQITPEHAKKVKEAAKK